MGDLNVPHLFPGIAVLGTPGEGEDSLLYAAMGYVPWSLRHAKGRRKRKISDASRGARRA
jgi:hypothetical protein